MTAITDALGVSRSNLYAKRGSTPRRRYRKGEDDVLLPLIREIADTRLTYGYPRITALLNRKLLELGRPRVNHKRVYRIMAINNLLSGYYLLAVSYRGNQESATFRFIASGEFQEGRPARRAGGPS